MCETNSPLAKIDIEDGNGQHILFDKILKIDFDTDFVHGPDFKGCGHWEATLIEFPLGPYFMDATAKKAIATITVIEDSKKTVIKGPVMGITCAMMVNTMTQWVLRGLISELSIEVLSKKEFSKVTSNHIFRYLQID
jgi:hypothetical protein